MGANGIGCTSPEVCGRRRRLDREVELHGVPHWRPGRAGPGAGSWLVWPARNAATWSIQAVTAWCPARAAAKVGHPYSRW